MRAFLCIELEKKEKEECSKIIEQINSLNLINANFVKSENLHLTLKFFGEIDEKQFEDIKNSLNRIEFNSFEAEIENIGFFPNENFIRVIWLALESKNNKILELKKLIDILFGDSFPEKGEFQSHITLARVKSIKHKQEFLEKIKNIQYERIKFSVNALVLKESNLTPEGPVYKELMRVKLK